MSPSVISYGFGISKEDEVAEALWEVEWPSDVLGTLPLPLSMMTYQGMQLLFQLDEFPTLGMLTQALEA